LTRAESAVLTPGRLLWSISAWRTQPRNVSGFDSQLTADPQQRARHGLAVLLVAVSNTSRTARWRRSAGYLLGAGIADSSPDGFRSLH
jgi:hypothetical protein